jgi:hypothetical protein
MGTEEYKAGRVLMFKQGAPAFCLLEIVPGVKFKVLEVELRKQFPFI